MLLDINPSFFISLEIDFATRWSLFQYYLLVHQNVVIFWKKRGVSFFKNIFTTFLMFRSCRFLWDSIQWLLVLRLSEFRLVSKIRRKFRFHLLCKKKSYAMPNYSHRICLHYCVFWTQINSHHIYELLNQELANIIFISI